MKTPDPSTVKIDSLILDYIKKYQDKPDGEIAKEILKDNPILRKKYSKSDNLRRRVFLVREDHNLPKISKLKLNKIPPNPREILKDQIKKLLKLPRTIHEIANQLDKSPRETESLINELREEKYNIVLKDDLVELSNSMQVGAVKRIDISAYENKTYKFGVISDNHLNSKYERLDVLNSVYDIFQQEGITEVYNAGNWIDGEARFNKFEIINHGITPQIEYFLKNYPKREGITTHFIAGDDHEGWYVQRERINIGEYTQMLAEKQGRFDLKYLGYVEADIEFKARKGKAIMKIMHPGGGSAYALSYTPQKIVESFSGGEKPNILIIGHYHKADYFFYRNTHVLQAGCTQDQTVFMRKLKIQAALGGWIIEMQQSKDGTINRFKAEWLAYFDKGYYKKQGYYRD